MTTSLDAHRALLKELDKYESPTFTIGDFNYFYPSAIEEYVAVNYATLDVNQKTLDDVRAILVLDEDLTLTNGEADLPTKYRHMLGMEAVLKFTIAMDGIAIDTERTVYPNKMLLPPSHWQRARTHRYPRFS